MPQLKAPSRQTAPQLKRLLLPKEKFPFKAPVYLPPRRGGQAGISLFVGGLATTGIALLFTLFTFPELLSGVLPPTQVVNTPPPPTVSIPLAEEGTPDQTLDPTLARPMVPPAFQARPVIAVSKPEMPRSETAPIIPQELLSQATAEAEMIEKIKEEQEAELAELRQKREIQERKRREQEQIAKKKREAEEAQRAAQRAIAKKQDAAKAREAAAQRAAKQEQAAKERAVAAARQQEQRERARQASLAKKVVSAPSVSRRTSPRYPNSARKAGAEGTTQIAATVNSGGRVSSAVVKVSSGHSALDSSALAAVKKWRFKPARNALGENVAHQLIVPVTFRLQ